MKSTRPGRRQGGRNGSFPAPTPARVQAPDQSLDDTRKVGLTAGAPARKTLGVRAFARRHHVAPSTVGKSIRNGRLERSVTRDARGHPRIDVSLGDAEWLENRDISKIRGRDGPGRLLTLNDLHPAVGAVYKARQDLDALTVAVWRMSGPEAVCQAILDALQSIPRHLRAIEDSLADAGVPLLAEDAK